MSEQLDARIQKLMTDYHHAVGAAIDLVRRSGISSPMATMFGDVRRLPQYGQLCDGSPYFRHGVGIAVYLKAGAVDFNFHDVASGDPDLGFVARFARETFRQYGFTSLCELEAELFRHRSSRYGKT